jgi:hypothetical protein
MDEVLECYPNNVEYIITAFCETCKLNPLECVTMVEAKKIFVEHFPLEDDVHTFSESSMKKYVETLLDIAIERTAGKLYENGEIDIAHDGIEFHYMLPRKTS